MAEQRDRDRSKDGLGREGTGAPTVLRSARPAPATAADIDRVLGAIGGLNGNIDAMHGELQEVHGGVDSLGERTQATEIRLDELSADIGDIRDAQDAQAQVVAEIRSRTYRLETVLAEAPRFDEIVMWLQALETRPALSMSAWTKAPRTSTPSGPTTPASGTQTPVPPQKNPHETDPTIVRLAAGRDTPETRSRNASLTSSQKQGCRAEKSKCEAPSWGPHPWQGRGGRRQDSGPEPQGRRWRLDDPTPHDAGWRQRRAPVVP